VRVRWEGAIVVVPDVQKGDHCIGTQKLKNVERNPKASVMLESGSTMQDIKGVIIQGEATAITEPDAVLPLMREAARRRGMAEDALPVEARPGTAYIKVARRKVISWDYGKVG
jgi:hypothetical protein